MAMHEARVEVGFLIADMRQATVGRRVEVVPFVRRLVVHSLVTVLVMRAVMHGIMRGSTLAHAFSALQAHAFAAGVEVAREFLNGDDSSVEKRMTRLGDSSASKGT